MNFFFFQKTMFILFSHSPCACNGLNPFKFRFIRLYESKTMSVHALKVFIRMATHICTRSSIVIDERFVCDQNNIEVASFDQILHPSSHYLQFHIDGILSRDGHPLDMAWRRVISTGVWTRRQRHITIDFVHVKPPRDFSLYRLKGNPLLCVITAFRLYWIFTNKHIKNFTICT